MEQEEGMSAREAWLKEHESVQDELSRMKQELMGDLLAKKKEAEKEQAPQLTGNENIKTLLAGKGDSLISRSTPTDMDKPWMPPTKKAKEGEIPKHPELSDFVARVMERENTINRKIFDREKEGREREAVIDRAQIEEAPEIFVPSISETPKTDLGGSVDVETEEPRSAADVSSPVEPPVAETAISTPSPPDTPMSASPISEPPIQEEEPKAHIRVMPVRRSPPQPSEPVSPPQAPSRMVNGVGSEVIPPHAQPRVVPPEQEPIPSPDQPPVEPRVVPPEQEPIPSSVQPSMETAPSEPSQPTSGTGPIVTDTVKTPGPGVGSGMAVPRPMGKVVVRRVIKKRE